MVFDVSHHVHYDPEAPIPPEKSTEDKKLVERVMTGSEYDVSLTKGGDLTKHWAQS
jgi:hypothetical protein